MAEQVQVNYEVLEQIEKRFAQLASEVQDVGRKISRQQNALRQGGWIGRGSDAFFAEMDDLVLPAIGRLGEALKEGGQVLGRVADLFNEAEESAQGGFAA